MSAAQPVAQIAAAIAAGTRPPGPRLCAACFFGLDYHTVEAWGLDAAPTLDEVGDFLDVLERRVNDASGYDGAGWPDPHKMVTTAEAAAILDVADDHELILMLPLVSIGREIAVRLWHVAELVQSWRCKFWDLESEQ